MNPDWIRPPGFPESWGNDDCRELIRHLVARNAVDFMTHRAHRGEGRGISENDAWKVLKNGTLTNRCPAEPPYTGVKFRMTHVLVDGPTTIVVHLPNRAPEVEYVGVITNW